MKLPATGRVKGKGLWLGDLSLLPVDHRGGLGRRAVVRVARRVFGVQAEVRLLWSGQGLGGVHGEHSVCARNDLLHVLPVLFNLAPQALLLLLDLAQSELFRRGNVRLLHILVFPEQQATWWVRSAQQGKRSEGRELTSGTLVSGAL